MKFNITHNSFEEVNADYPFSHDVFMWLAKELCKRIRPSKHFTNKYGKDWMLTFDLSAKRQRKNPKVFEPPAVYRRDKNVYWRISVRFIGNKSRDPNYYVLPIKQFIEGIIIALQSLEIDTSKLVRDLPSLAKGFTSNPDMFEVWGEVDYVRNVESECPAKTARKPRKKKLPEWNIPRNVEQLAEDEGGMWESDRFDPIVLVVWSDTSAPGRKGGLSWEIQFDPCDEHFATTSEKIKATGIEPDGDAWADFIEKEFVKRYPTHAVDFYSDSESSTCVIRAETESACQKLIELVWSLIYPKPD